LAERFSPLQRLTPVFLLPPAAGSLEEHVRAEQVRLVFQQAPPAQLIAVVAAGTVVWALWGVGDHDLLRAWFGVIVLATVGRIGLGLAFRRSAPVASAMMPWELAFLLTLSIISLAWGIGGWAIMPRQSQLHEAVVYFFLMGVAGGAVATYSAHAAACLIAICALMVPATVAFALQPAPELRALAVGGMLYLLAAIRSTRNYGFYLRQTFKLSFELQEAYQRARDQARTDELTELANRRAFVERGNRALQQAKRYMRPLSLVMFDIDHFKRINDNHGHAAGDQVLRQVAALAAGAARATDTAGRLGGEEFGVLLPETPIADAMRFAERLRDRMSQLAIPHESVWLRLTCSFGVAQAGENTETLDVLLGMADAALYKAKSEGRNRVVRV
jgi:diguanylate cyclase (GGDEF)-like protein